MDFTAALPRVLSIYIFSFLDPRSLCRCSQVSWHWKNITELDQIWMPKCIKLGWMLPFTPDPYEIGVWKRQYIENIITLKCMTPIKPKSSRTPRTPISQSKPNTAREARSSSASRPPWKGSDPVPKDIWRNNYLDNKDEVGIVKKLRETGKYFNQESISKRVNTGKHVQIPRSKSVTTGDINKYTGERPSWAVTNGNGTYALDLNTSRPAPVQRQPKARPKSGKRTNRDPPVDPLFTDRPWNLINDDDEC
ncbi:DgyrCDS6992 [Dimorphilus gyrociliatus]|nr:DgyrCDS6992 [Dimorphilus gyrociliatus]